MNATKKNLALCLATLGLMLALPAMAQNNPECLGTQCGTPDTVGGGCSCSCGCSVWVAYTDDGVTLSYTDDADGDGKADGFDNCPFASNRDQLDDDGDGVGNSCDNCSGNSNIDQIDTDGDGSGDLCDGDIDNDTVPNLQDNCPSIPNSTQQKTLMASTLGDACNPDVDGDGAPNGADNCPLIPNPSQALPANTSGCNVDLDGDNISDSFDNCPGSKNPSQLDTDGDGIGDVCDLDKDNDGILNKADNCQLLRNRDQKDDDGDGSGDLCDPHYCVVVDPMHPEACLDPMLPFQVHGGGFVTLKRGEKFRLPLFANRNGAAIEYKWTVLARPAGSSAPVENPTGAVTMSRHWQYAYQDGHVPSFTADVDGDYRLQLSGKLVFADRAYPLSDTATSELSLKADGAKGAACSAIPADASLAGLGLALLAMIRRRRS